MESTDLAALTTLDALLQEGSVTKAALRLGLSAPAVSHALSRLRERFEDPLLVRAGRSMVLTPRAEQLRPLVRDAILVADRVFEAPAEFEPSRLERRFVMSATDYVLTVLGTDFDERLTEAAPQLDLVVIPNAVDDADRLRDGDTDLAVGIYGELPPELRTRPLITDRLVCVVREGHPAVRRKLTLKRFVALEHIQIAPRGRPGGYVDELLVERGMSRRVARAVPYFSAALQMVAGSDRILTVSERIARLAAPTLGLTVVEPPLALEPFALSMVWHPRFDADPAHRWIREQLLEVSRERDGLVHRSARKRLSRSDPTGRR
ncbi:MAG: LysR family transcriptional regulator [Deltaproteobacteria bacterium]